MARIGVVIIMGAIIISMVAGLYAYVQYQPNITATNAGELVIVGPVEYSITFEGTHKGDKDTKPEHVFAKIRINAKNITAEETRMTGGQFTLFTENELKHIAVYGGFSEEDLIDDILEPNKPVSWTTQFDVEFDETKKYQIAIRPTKVQASTDIGIVCLTNCE